MDGGREAAAELGERCYVPGEGEGEGGSGQE